MMYEITIKNNGQGTGYGYKSKIKTKFYCGLLNVIAVLRKNETRFECVPYDEDRYTLDEFMELLDR